MRMRSTRPMARRRKYWRSRSPTRSPPRRSATSWTIRCARRSPTCRSRRSRPRRTSWSPRWKDSSSRSDRDRLIRPPPPPIERSFNKAGAAMQRWAAIGVFAAGILASGPTMAAEARIKVGSLTLAPCEAAGTYCGHMARPLDPTGGLKDTIDIFFEYFPARDRSQEKLGTLVAAEGGPGFPTTGSAETYLKLYAPLRDRRDVVMMDYRGTGHSGAIDCHPLQTAPKFTVENVARCGAQLGPRAPLYSAAYDADDLAAILDALGAGKVDLYGDSYGTWFAQAFAIRHGDRLRSIILDGAYPVAQVGGESPWWPFYAPAMRRKFDLVCARDSACAAAPGSSIDHIKPALELLRAHPFDAVAKDADGTE